MTRSERPLPDFQRSSVVRFSLGKAALHLEHDCQIVGRRSDVRMVRAERPLLGFEGAPEHRFGIGRLSLLGKKDSEIGQNPGEALSIFAAFSNGKYAPIKRLRL